MAGGRAAWALIDGQANFRRSTRNVSPENSRKGDLLWVWIPFKLRIKKKSVKLCIMDKPLSISEQNLWFPGTGSGGLITRKASMDIRAVTTLGGGAQLHILSASKCKTAVLSLVPQEQSPRGGRHDLLKKCSRDKLAREWGKPARGRERNQARLLL